jgi:hypothetical protein
MKKEGEFNWGGAGLLYSSITRVNARLAQLYASMANRSGSPRYMGNSVGETMNARRVISERIQAFGFGTRVSGLKRDLPFFTSTSIKHRLGVLELSNS